MLWLIAGGAGLVLTLIVTIVQLAGSLSISEFQAERIAKAAETKAILNAESRERTALLEADAADHQALLGAAEQRAKDRDRRRANAERRVAAIEAQVEALREEGKECEAKLLEPRECREQDWLSAPRSLSPDAD